jgi:hypothetical protein
MLTHNNNSIKSTLAAYDAESFRYRSPATKRRDQKRLSRDPLGRLAMVAKLCRKTIAFGLICAGSVFVSSCADLGPSDRFAPWVPYDFYGAMTIMIPSHFGGPNFEFSDDESAGWNNEAMTLYLLRGKYMGSPGWMVRNPEYTVLPMFVDGRRATLVTCNAASESRPLFYYVQLSIADPNSDDINYLVYAECYTLESREMAIRMFMSIHFKFKKLV